MRFSTEFYSLPNGKIAVLTSGFTKKSKKTPKAESLCAMGYKINWENRN